MRAAIPPASRAGEGRRPEAYTYPLPYPFQANTGRLRRPLCRGSGRNPPGDLEAGLFRPGSTSPKRERDREAGRMCKPTGREFGPGSGRGSMEGQQKPLKRAEDSAQRRRRERAVGIGCRRWRLRGRDNECSSATMGGIRMSTVDHGLGRSGHNRCAGSFGHWTRRDRLSNGRESSGTSAQGVSIKSSSSQ